MFFNGYQNNRIEVTVFDLTGTTVMATINWPTSNNEGIIIIMLIVIWQRMETTLLTSLKFVMVEVVTVWIAYASNGNNIASLPIE